MVAWTWEIAEEMVTDCRFAVYHAFIVEPIGFVDGFHVKGERKRKFKDDSKLFDPNYWMLGLFLKIRTVKGKKSGMSSQEFCCESRRCSHTEMLISVR